MEHVGSDRTSRSLPTLHEKLLALVKLSRYLAGEAWAYYGDLDETHLSDVGRGLAEAARERERLEALLQALDFELIPAGERHRATLLGTRVLSVRDLARESLFSVRSFVVGSTLW